MFLYFAYGVADIITFRIRDGVINDGDSGFNGANDGVFDSADYAHGFATPRRSGFQLPFMLFHCLGMTIDFDISSSR
ncbi:hypothetical protein [Mycolicibacterium goodii]|uniref:hypothetical protein n=1 Tax=Mycolicibacterium goodii TaxID=134601 RepID=UPI00256F0985|nr:hypothetical protein [Mycolicibacterium goodii]